MISSVGITSESIEVYVHDKILHTKGMGSYI